MTVSKYNPNKNGNKSQPHNYKVYDPNLRLYFPHQNGCSKYSNCLTCPFPDCVWDESRGGGK